MIQLHCSRRFHHLRAWQRRTASFDVNMASSVCVCVSVDLSNNRRFVHSAALSPFAPITSPHSTYSTRMHRDDTTRTDIYTSSAQQRAQNQHAQHAAVQLSNDAYHSTAQSAGDHQPAGAPPSKQRSRSREERNSGASAAKGCCGGAERGNSGPEQRRADW